VLYTQRLETYAGAAIKKRSVSLKMGRVSIVETDLDFVNELSYRPETNFFVVHHVGDINRDVSAAEIHKWHLANGWSGCGYHYVIRKDGSIERGRPRTTLGSHCYGFNRESIGINVVGDFANYEPEEAQMESLANLIADLCEIYDLPSDEETIVGHRDKNSTDCPGDNMYNRLGELRERVTALL
jgi:N-acetyl-anhydromuramyl-L-alanine amidase AmpD